MSHNLQINGQPQVNSINFESTSGDKATVKQQLSTNIEKKLEGGFRNMVANFFHKRREGSLKQIKQDLDSGILKKINGDINLPNLPKTTKKLIEQYVKAQPKQAFDKLIINKDRYPRVEPVVLRSPMATLQLHAELI